jgi:type III secretion protein J
VLMKVAKKCLQFLFLTCVMALLCSCESSRTIVNGLDEKEANEIIVFLSTRGIVANKVKSSEGGGTGAAKATMWDISVGEDKATEAMSLLNQSGLPRRRGQNLLGLFQNVGLVPSEMQDKIRYQAGLAEQIASTIRKIDGILDAEVQLSFPEEDPLNPGAEKKQKITGSVYVKHSGVLDDPNSHLVTKIKRLVAASITGLDFDNVTVIGDRARFTDLPSGVLSSAVEEEKQYVTVWSVIVAQSSLFRFQLLFFSFTIAILLLLLSLVWVIWKVYPLLSRHGGIKELFHIHPIALEEEGTAEAPKEEKKPGEETKPTQDKGLVDEDIDET